MQPVADDGGDLTVPTGAHSLFAGPRAVLGRWRWLGVGRAAWGRGGSGAHVNLPGYRFALRPFALARVGEELAGDRFSLWALGFLCPPLTIDPRTVSDRLPRVLARKLEDSIDEVPVQKARELGDR